MFLNCRDTEKVVYDSFTNLFCVARKTNSKRSVASFVYVKKSWIIQTKPVKLKHVTLKLIWRHTHFPCFHTSLQIFGTTIFLCSYNIFMKFFCGATFPVAFICLRQKLADLLTFSKKWEIAPLLTHFTFSSWHFHENFPCR